MAQRIERIGSDLTAAIKEVEQAKMHHVVMLLLELAEYRLTEFKKETRNEKKYPESF
ncbi:MAG: hypothetical protein JSV31_10025 [Desulfobacterales bacterium]|nr:MAG: hypothetical protein JSV31_10025 [Desulfobacterales bacterium]